MDGSAYIALAVAIVGLLTSLVTLVSMLIGLKRGAKRDDKIQQLTLSVDGRLTQLLAMNAKSSHAEGVLEEKTRGTTP